MKQLERIRTGNPYSLSMDELGNRQIAINNRHRESPGVLYARKQNRSEKDDARRHILSIFKRKNWPSGLSILTMPGLSWEFERALLSLREGNWQSRTHPSRSTHIAAVELDPAVYMTAVLSMPRKVGTPIVTYYNTPMWCAHMTGSDAIRRFSNCDVFALMKHNQHEFDAAWLDFNGPLSTEKLERVKTFYWDWIKSVLVLTFLNARHDKTMSHNAAENGGIAEWLNDELCGDVIHCLRYQDGNSPMVQYAVRRREYTREGTTCA